MRGSSKQSESPLYFIYNLETECKLLASLILDKHPPKYCLKYLIKKRITALLPELWAAFVQPIFIGGIFYQKAPQISLRGIVFA
jgi:hypothetical protein